VAQNKRTIIIDGARFILIHAVGILTEYDELIAVDTLPIELRNQVFADVEFIRSDTRDRETIQYLMINVDVAFHEAAIVSISQLVRSPEETHDINLAGAVNILESA
jgi:UDP-glucose 4-epimerase